MTIATTMTATCGRIDLFKTKPSRCVHSRHSSRTKSPSFPQIRSNIPTNRPACERPSPAPELTRASAYLTYFLARPINAPTLRYPPHSSPLPHVLFLA
ncbi:hypothetical protein BC567DRAFT_236083, partial [Phyllosticta citribraziliensis]